MYRKLIIVLAMIGFFFLNDFTVSSNPIDNNQTISVEIKGEVLYPDVYEFELGSTYGDLFEKAGLSDSADISTFSLNRVLYDNELIVVPAKTENKLISINSAPLEELILLPGIGEATAKKIIEYRENEGSFLKLEDLMNVKGIGHGKFEKLKGLICL
ncbi:MAG: helix-hairpin-helix domain-containing protein [Erysipelotrichaceae bacterium]|nr:helix-hairpin-helix domain-containing protein [Erysipelotrichaceae bacterium]